MKSISKAQYGLLALLLFAANFWFMTTTVSAANLTNSYIQLNRMTAVTPTTVRVVFKTIASSNSSTTMSINFDGADSTKWSTSSGSVFTGSVAPSSGTCAAATGATALPGGSLAAVGSGSNLISVSAISPAFTATPTLYCVDFTLSNAVTTPTAGEYHPVITIGSDSITVAVRTVSNDSIVVSATVPPTFNLALSGTTDTFTGNLAAGSVKVSTGNTVTINTNATNGWFVWAYSVSSSGLTSVIAGTNIPIVTAGTSATLVAGTPGYVFGVTGSAAGTGTGAITIPAAYTSNGTTTGSGLDTTIRQIASSNGTNAGATLTIKELAAISATTPAANDYTDTITIIGAGYF